MTITFYKNTLQACEERGFLQVYFTCPTHYNNWKEDNLQPRENSRLSSSSLQLHCSNNSARGIFKCLNHECSKPQPDAIFTSQAVLLLITPAHFLLEKDTEAKGRKGTPPP